MISSVVNGGQAILSKAGDYLDHPVEQLNNDAGAVGDFFASQYNYYTKTKGAQILKDTKDFFSDPDNYFHAAEDAFATVAIGKFSIPGEVPSVPKISVANNFTLKTAEAATADGSYYSVAYETKLPSNLYPGKGYYSHFKAANEALHTAIQSDATFASTIQDLGIKIPRSATGTILGKSPENWVWHHDIQVGVMQLTLKSQHTAGSILWDAMHPGGVGGMSTWGK